MFSKRRLTAGLFFAGLWLATPGFSAGSYPLVMSTDLYGTKYLDQGVRIEGRVLDVFHDDMSSEYFFALVEDEFGKIYLAVNIRNQRDYPIERFVGARISACGLCFTTVFSNFRRYLDREVSSWIENVAVLSEPERQPFDAPLVSKTIDLPTEQILKLGRRRMFGTVLAVRHADELLIRTRDGTVSRVELRSAGTPAVGSGVEVVGNVETDLHHINLSRAVWRPASVASAPSVAATNVTSRFLLKDSVGRSGVKFSHHGRTVRIRGKVLSLPVPDFPERTFVVDCEGVPFPVDAGMLGGAMPPLKVGCEVELDGVCWIEMANWRYEAVFPKARGFTLVLRTPADIKVVAWPPWWSPGKLLSVIGLLFIALAGVGVWNRVLRKLVERRGRQIFREQATRMEAELKADERSRLAVELHDSISQVLTGVALKIKAAQGQARTDLDKALFNLGLAERALRSSREELRYCLWDLRNNLLDLTNLEEAVRQTLKPQTGEVKLFVRLSVSRRHLSDNQTHLFLQIVRELAVNAIRHGGATEIRVAGSLEKGVLAFSVSDNGRGFDISSAPGPEQGHFGLQGVRDRIAHFNGTLDIRSRPGGGTKAVVSIEIGNDAGGASA